VTVFCIREKDGATVKWAGSPRHVGLVAIARSSRVHYFILDFRKQVVGIYLRQVFSAFYFQIYF
jgi:hypothetical protein